MGTWGGALPPECDNPLPIRALNCPTPELLLVEDVNPRHFHLLFLQSGLVRIELMNTERYN